MRATSRTGVRSDGAVPYGETEDMLQQRARRLSGARPVPRGDGLQEPVDVGNRRLPETDPVALRAELVQVAAVAVKWVRMLDARADHTEG